MAADRRNVMALQIGRGRIVRCCGGRRDDDSDMPASRAATPPLANRCAAPVHRSSRGRSSHLVGLQVPLVFKIRVSARDLPQQRSEGRSGHAGVGRSGTLSTSTNGRVRHRRAMTTLTSHEPPTSLGLHRDLARSHRDHSYRLSDREQCIHGSTACRLPKRGPD